MKDLIKIMLVLALVFASIFIIVKATGVFSLDGINVALAEAQQIHPVYLIVIVVGLLFSDLLIAVPTMTVSIMAGYFLGWPMGAMATLGGLYLAGITGYVISRIYGYRLLNHIYKDKQRLEDIHNHYSEYGPAILVICRAMPVLPEVSCCMAGATHMSFSRFLTMYSLGTVPYALIITYVGSISSLENPTPAVMAAIGMSITLWLSWFFLWRKMRKQ